ncbi:MAG: sugar porter family MFS transporter [Pseudomonadota bacterium]
MTREARFATSVALVVALGGFLMGFDASVISGVVGFVEDEFSLNKIEVGWVVASLTLTATLAMMLAGPLSDRIGRRPVLTLAAVLFAASAVASALAPNYWTLVAARMLGGLGVGAALIIAPMYIAEIAPAAVRGRLVSFNQLNIVIGISAAFFSNYFILKLGESDLGWAKVSRVGEWGWRWMLGVEAAPALFYLAALVVVPESPRWLAMRGRHDEALAVLGRFTDAQNAKPALAAVRDSLAAQADQTRLRLGELFAPRLGKVLLIGITVAVLQQLTGINAVFFYAPMIFEQSGIGTDAAFLQATLVGLVNLVFTVAALLLIDRVGRRPLLCVGLAGIAVCMLTLAWGFGQASYTLGADALAAMPDTLDVQRLASVVGVTFGSDIAFREAVIAAVGGEAFAANEAAFVSAAIAVDPRVILVAILGFVASFAMSLGPVMWVLFSELFPNRLRGLAVSFVGLINSAVSFGVQLVFPWELERLGNATTFALFGIVAALGFFMVLRLVPETKGRTLEQLEATLSA